ncbi:PAS domain S-box protein [Roseomonas genomospecies 6]|nr:PAS domain S-box protein [Roseomonas genomospecies 6]
MTVRNADVRTDGRSSVSCADSENWLGLALEGAGMGAWRCCPESGRFEATATAKRLHGLPDDALLDAAAAMEVVHPDDRERVRQALETAIKYGEPYYAEFRTVLPSGTIRWLLSRGRWVSSPGEPTPHMVGVVQDISERRQAEEALARSEERFRVALADAPIVVFCQDRDLRYTWMYNPRMGFVAADVLGKTDAELLDPESAAPVMAVKRQVLATGEPARAEVTTACSGRVETYDLYVEALRDADGRIVGVRCAATDITERKRAEEALRNSEARFRTLFDTLTLGVVLQDASGEITDANAAAQDILGLSFDELRGRVSRDPRWHATDEHGQPLESNAHPAMLALRTGQPVQLRMMGVFNPRRGERRWLEVDAIPQFRPGDPQPSMVCSVFHDVTDQRRAEQALRDSEERLREAQDIAGLGFWEFDVIARNITWCDAIFRMLGRDPREGPPTFDEVRTLLHPEDRPLLDTFVERAAATCEDYEVDWRLRHVDGAYRWVRTRARAFADKAGQCVRLVGTDLDITERKRVDEDLRRLVEQRETLVREAHHRIKNSIASIAGLLAMQARSEASDTAREALLDAQQRVHTVGRIHEALYRSESFTAVDVGAHLQALMGDIARSAVTRKGHPPTLRLQCPVGIDLSADTVTPLSMIAVELVTNALKYAGGAQDDVEIDIALASGSPMRLVVADNGQGLPAGARKTSGLGLRLVDLLTRQLRGTVSFENTPTGLRVTVAFPSQRT